MLKEEGVTGIITSGPGTALYNTLLNERETGREEEVEEIS
jgi:hypothetical protein